MQHFPLWIFSRKYLWSGLLWFFLASGVTAEHPSPTKTPCAEWNPQFQQPLARTTIPEPLHQFFAVQQGRGFTASFTEEKHLTVLRTPLLSSGELIFLPTRGLYRQLQHPFAQELLITADAIHQRTTGTPAKTLTLDAFPGAKAFVAAFFALFSGSWDALHTHFAVYFAQAGPHWSLGLKPINEATAKIISCLVLEGHQAQLLSLQVQETNGDITKDLFRNPQILPEARWGEYQAQFDWTR